MADLERGRIHRGRAARQSELCLRYAGVLRCATDVDDDVTAHAVSGLMQSLDGDRPVLVAHVEHGNGHDYPGFLTGAAGVALSLSELAGLPARPVTTPWDALLLIA